MRVLRRFIIATAMIAIAGLGAKACTREFRAATCVDRIAGRYPAPDGEREAVVVVRNCGATTGIVTHVFVARPGDRLAGRNGNALVVDSDYSAAPYLPGGGIPLEIQWIRSDSLVLRYSAKARVGFAGSSSRGARVTHVRYPARGA